MPFRITQACTGCTACLKVCPTQAIRGERKLLHVVDPAVCIECGACGRICPAGAVLNAGAGLCRQVQRSRWPRPVVLEGTCVSCNACLQACPVNALDVKKPLNRSASTAHFRRYGGENGQLTISPFAGEGGRAPDAAPPHLIPYLRDEKACIGCAFCEETCPVRAIRMGRLQKM